MYYLNNYFSIVFELPNSPVAMEKSAGSIINFRILWALDTAREFALSIPAWIASIIYNICFGSIGLTRTYRDSVLLGVSHLSVEH